MQSHAIQCCENILSLNANFGEEGALVLAEGLKCCRNLKVLKINSNSIGSVGA